MPSAIFSLRLAAGIGEAGAVHRDYLSYKQRYRHTTVLPAQIRLIEAELLLRLNAGIESVEVRPGKPPAFKDEFGASWKRFEAILAAHGPAIRKFAVLFMTEKNFTNRADCVCLDLFVRNQGHFGEPEPREIYSFGLQLLSQGF